LWLKCCTGTTTQHSVLVRCENITGRDQGGQASCST